jgi:hypothetical protein
MNSTALLFRTPPGCSSQPPSDRRLVASDFTVSPESLRKNPREW